MNGATILVVEDEALVRDVVCAVLRQGGDVVLEAATGAAAEAVCRQHPGAIHLLVADVMLPDANGLDLARRLVRLRPGVKVLLMSGDIPQGGYPWLGKPFAPPSLVQKVREVLASASQPPGGGLP
jgi:CheY-like chemotaxis protein